MEVLLTGGSGKVGTAITDHLGGSDQYEFVALDPEPHPDCETYTESVTDYEAIRPAFDGVDAVVHLAVYPPGIVDENWEMIDRVNVQGTYNVLEACRDAGVETVVFASTNHVVGGYELEFEPDIYYHTDVHVDHEDPVRPDSYYGVTKLFGEHLGRFHVECKDAPSQFYALRICSLREEEYDHPYGDAERGVERGDFERGTRAYEDAVARMKAMWFSRRDCAQLVELMLRDEDVDFDVFYGLSGNERRWHDISHARDVLGYEPRDDGETWDEPPE
jgi:nucleoside-diphosphate-sugar epimerase